MNDMYDSGFEHLIASRFEDALEIFNKAPKTKKARNLEYLENKRQYGRARVFCQQAQIAGNNKEALLQQVEEILTPIIEKAPRFISAYICLGRAYEQQGEINVASDLYAKGLEHSPGNYKLIGCLEYLEQKNILDFPQVSFTPLKDSRDSGEEEQESNISDKPKRYKVGLR